MNTDAKEPKKVSKVDLRVSGRAHVFYTDGSSEDMSLEEYRVAIVNRVIDVDDVRDENFLTNATESPTVAINPEIAGQTFTLPVITAKSPSSVHVQYARIIMVLAGLGALTTMFVYHPYYALVIAVLLLSVLVSLN